MIEAHHRREALVGNVGRVRHRDQRVRVRRVADDEDPDVVGGAGVDRLALGLEDRAVGLEQVGALHPRTARPRADEQADVGAVEGELRIVGDLDLRKQRESAVVELHRGALGGLDRVGDLEQPQLNRGVLAEHLAGRDPEEECVANLAGGAGDGDLDGIAH